MFLPIIVPFAAAVLLEWYLVVKLHLRTHTGWLHYMLGTGCTCRYSAAVNIICLCWMIMQDAVKLSTTQFDLLAVHLEYNILCLQIMGLVLGKYATCSLNMIRTK